MDIIELIDKELASKHLSELEKLRYIYLRCCDLFHFDTRWVVAGYLNDDKMEKGIINEPIDLRNLEDFSTICFKISLILKGLINEFTDYNVRTIRTETHAYNEVSDNKNRFKIDPSYGDMPRVKLNIIPTGMSYLKKDGITLIEKDSDFGEMDKELGFHFVDRERYPLLIKTTDPKEAAIEIGKLLRKTNAQYHFTDASHFLDLFYILCRQRLENVVDKNLQMHRLVTINDSGEQFELCKKDGFYDFSMISQDRFDYVDKVLRYK